MANKSINSTAVTSGNAGKAPATAVGGPKDQSQISGSTNARTLRTSTSTFRDTVQRGVLSGIGLLKK